MSKDIESIAIETVHQFASELVFLIKRIEAKEIILKKDELCFGLTMKVDDTGIRDMKYMGHVNAIKGKTPSSEEFHFITPEYYMYEDNGYHYRIYMAGINKKETEIRVLGRETLKIHAKHVGTNRIYYLEISLPSKIYTKPEQMKANYDDGILTLSFVKDDYDTENVKIAL